MNAIPRSKPLIIFSSEPMEHFRKNRTENFPKDLDLLDTIRRLNDGFMDAFGSRFQFQFHPEDGYLRVASDFGTLTVIAADEIDDAHQVQMDLAYVAMFMFWDCVNNRDPADLRRGVQLFVASQNGMNDASEEPGSFRGAVQ